jgi:hypothetical protein
MSNNSLSCWIMTYEYWWLIFYIIFDVDWWLMIWWIIDDLMDDGQFINHQSKHQSSITIKNNLSIIDKHHQLLIVSLSVINSHNLLISITGYCCSSIYQSSIINQVVNKSIIHQHQNHWSSIVNMYKSSIINKHKSSIINQHQKSLKWYLEIILGILLFKKQLTSSICNFAKWCRELYFWYTCYVVYSKLILVEKLSWPKLRKRHSKHQYFSFLVKKN